jgi:hypothetical protein
MNNCKDCKFYHDPKYQKAECRRYPPQLVFMDDNVFEISPNTEEDHWCGEFSPRIEKSVAWCYPDYGVANKPNR